MPFKPMVAGGQSVGKAPYANKYTGQGACKKLCEKKAGCKTAALVDRTPQRKASTCFLFKEDASRAGSATGAKAQTIFYCRTGVNARPTSPAANRFKKFNLGPGLAGDRPATQSKKIGSASVFGSPIRVSAGTFERQDELALQRISGRKPVKVATRAANLETVIFRVQCSLLGNARMDPIITPGRPSDHVHAFFGPNTAAVTINNADLRQGIPTTCNLKEDMSMYWVPAMYQRDPRRGNKLFLVPIKSVHYYFDSGGGDLYSMPLGLELFTGMGRARWFCLSSGFFTSDEWDHIPPARGHDGRLCERIQTRLEFPTCWNGRQLRTPDESHYAYAERSRCPASHPFRLPQIRSVYTWFIDTKGKHDLVLANGDKKGDQMHSDFVSGWPDNTFPTMLAKCEKNGGAGCNVSNLSPKNVKESAGSTTLTFRKNPPKESVDGLSQLRRA